MNICFRKYLYLKLKVAILLFNIKNINKCAMSVARFVEIKSLFTKVSFCLSDGQPWEGWFYLQPPACDRGG